MGGKDQSSRYVAGQSSASTTTRNLLRESERMLELLSAHPGDGTAESRLLEILDELDERYERTKDRGDADAAAQIGKKILALFPNGHDSRGQFLFRIMLSLWERYKLEKQAPDLLLAVNLGREIHRLAKPVDATILASFLSIFGGVLEDEFDLHHSTDVLDELIEISEEAVAAASTAGLVRPDLQLQLARRVETLSEVKASPQQLDRAIEITKQVISETRPGETFRLEALIILQQQVLKRHGTAEAEAEPTSLDLIDEVITLATKEIPSIPVNNSGRVRLMLNLHGLLLIRFDKLGENQDLDDAIVIARKAAQSPTADGPQKDECIDALARTLGVRCLKMNEASDIEEAISLGQQILTRTTTNPDDRATWLAYLGMRFNEKYDNENRVSDLNQAISLISEAIDTGVPEDPDLPTLEGTLGTLLLARHDRTWDLESLEEAIKRTKHALSLMEDSHPVRASALSNLANQLGTMYERTGHEDTLDEAITKARDATAIQNPENEDKAGCLGTLANWLAVRHKRTGKREDIDESIQFSRDALRLEDMDESSNDWPSFANNLATSLTTLYDETGDPGSLIEAITYLEEALDRLPKDSPVRPVCEITLADALTLQYERTGDLPQLELAVQMARSAADGDNLDPLDRAIYLNNLGNDLEVLFDRNKDIRCIRQAIEAEEKAASLFGQKHIEYPGTLRSLADKFRCLYTQTLEPTDLDSALATAQIALDALPADHPERCDYLDSLATVLEDMSEISSDQIRELDKAIETGGLALSSLKQNGPSRGLLLFNQGRRLERLYHLHCFARPTREQERSSESYLHSAIRHYVLASKSEASLPIQRFKAGRAAARLLCSLSKWKEAADILAGLSNLLPLVCGRYSSRVDQQYAINQTAGFASDACSLTLKAGESAAKALQQLEFGRGLILNYAIESRSTMKTSLDLLREKEPELAWSFEDLQLKASSTAPRYTSDIHGEGKASAAALKSRKVIGRIKASQEMSVVLDKIHRVRGFEGFFREPLLEDLLSQNTGQRETLVVVNVTEIGSDALLIIRNQLHHVPLPQINPDRAPKPFHWHLESRLRDDAVFRRQRDRSVSLPRDIASQVDRSWCCDNALAWLWTACVGPIFDALQKLGVLTNDHKEGDVVPRIWWSGAGAATSFPFHAAAAARFPDRQGALDNVVSSYFNSIRALQYARSRGVTALSSDHGSALIVTMPETPGYRPLPGADREGTEVQRVFEASTAPFSARRLRSPRAADVMENLHKSAILHFAGHGSSDPVNPSQSCLLLRKQQDEEDEDRGLVARMRGGGLVVDKLTVSQISDESEVGSNRAWLAFLSACSTAKVTVPELANEGLHLASAFQLAGFAHVVGSLWPVDDDVCFDVARRFYEVLLSGHFDAGPDELNGLVARALRNAVMGVRQDHADRPELWAPFVHFGA